jgi:hypothetical protein
MIEVHFLTVQNGALLIALTFLAAVGIVRVVRWVLDILP